MRTTKELKPSKSYKTIIQRRTVNYALQGAPVVSDGSTKVWSQVKKLCVFPSYLSSHAYDGKTTTFNFLFFEIKILCNRTCSGNRHYRMLKRWRFQLDHLFYYYRSGDTLHCLSRRAGSSVSKPCISAYVTHEFLAYLFYDFRDRFLITTHRGLPRSLATVFMHALLQLEPKNDRFWYTAFQ